MKKHLLNQSGETSEGHQVYRGVYAFYETHGLPLDVILTCFQEQQVVVDWLDFWDEGIKAGVKPRKLSIMIEQACGDVLGGEESKVIMIKLKGKREETVYI